MYDAPGCGLCDITVERKGRDEKGHCDSQGHGGSIARFLL